MKKEKGSPRLKASPLVLPLCRNEADHFLVVRSYLSIYRYTPYPTVLHRFDEGIDLSGGEVVAMLKLTSRNGTLAANNIGYLLETSVALMVYQRANESQP